MSGFRPLGGAISAGVVQGSQQACVEAVRICLCAKPSGWFDDDASVYLRTSSRDWMGVSRKGHVGSAPRACGVAPAWFRSWARAFAGGQALRMFRGSGYRPAVGGARASRRQEEARGTYGFPAARAGLRGHARRAPVRRLGRPADLATPKRSGPGFARRRAAHGLRPRRGCTRRHPARLGARRRKLVLRAGRQYRASRPHIGRDRTGAADDRVGCGAGAARGQGASYLPAAG